MEMHLASVPSEARAPLHRPALLGCCLEVLALRIQSIREGSSYLLVSEAQCSYSSTV